MKFNSYCIALIVLVLFFMYLDNSVNMEGYADIDGSESVQDQVDDQVGVQVDDQVDDQVTQDIQPIGAKPQKIPYLNTPSSLEVDLSVVTKDGDVLASLDEAFKGSLMGPQPVPTQIPFDLKAIGSRVGGPGNIGDESMGSVGGPVPSGELMGMGAPVAFDSGLDEDLGMVDVGVAEPSPDVVQPSGPPKTLEVHMVYANWCGHSKQAEPHMDRLIKDIDGTKKGDHLVKVYKHDADTPEGKKMAEEHNVRGFPTHFIIVEGRKIEDGIGRTYDELMSKVHELTGV